MAVSRLEMATLSITTLPPKAEIIRMDPTLQKTQKGSLFNLYGVLGFSDNSKT